MRKTLFFVIIGSLSLAIKASDQIAVDSATVDYYKALIERYQGNPASVHLEDFSETFFPAEAAPPEAQESLTRCHGKAIIGECEPDTFYSWGPEGKIKNVKRNTPDALSWGSINHPRGRTFMTHTSVGSYCYGVLPLRIKYRPGRTGSLDGLNRRVWGQKHNFHEWTTSDQRGIESISFAQPEHIDEIILEIQRRLESDDWAQSPLYYDMREAHKVDMDDKKVRIIHGCIPERHQLKEEVLVGNIIHLLEAYFNGDGWIHYQGQAPSPCNRKKHFETDFPTFWNPS